MRRRIHRWATVTVVVLLAGLLVAAPAGAADGDVAWARQLGGTSLDSANGVAVDGLGDVYVAGGFYGTVDFDPGPGEWNLTSAGSSDAYVSKLDTAGTLVWTRQFGGIDYAGGSGIAVDGVGNVYVTGSYTGTVDFDPGPGVSNLSSAGQSGFVVKLDAAGGLVWTRQLGGTGAAAGSGIAVDGLGNAYVTGYFRGTADFDPGVGVRNLTAAGSSADGFAWKLGAAGGLVWARRLGSTAGDLGTGVGVDGSGNVYVTGNFYGTVDFDPGPGVWILASGPGGDGFVWKLGAAGSLVWARQLGGTNWAYGRGVAVDKSDDVYVTGGFYGTADFDPGPGVSNLTSAGVHDGFVWKLDAMGSLVWARQLGGNPRAGGLALAVAGSGDVYVTGGFYGTADFDPGPGVSNLVAAGADDGFVWKLDAVGSLVWARQLGGTDYDFGSGVGVDGSGNVYVTGGFDGMADFDPGPGVLNLMSAGLSDGFVVRLEGVPVPPVGLVDPSQGLWHLRNELGVVTSFYYGVPGDYPFVGDWDCDGIDTPGLYRQSDGFAYLRNTNSFGVADISYHFGVAGDIPIAGDFNGDGCDTLSIYRPAEGRVYISDTLGSNGGFFVAEFAYYFGNPGDKPFTGDFDGDGIDTIGLHRESTGLVYFRNTHSFGVADNQFYFGIPADRLVAGDWGLIDGADTPAVFRPAETTFYFRHTNTQGNADTQFTWGQATWLPIAGVFQPPG